jgi:hypothetical protein
MKRTQGLVPLAILHHVTAAVALLAMLGHCLNPSDKTNLQSVLQVCAFAFLTVIIRRGWASIDGGSENLRPGKAQGFLWIPFFNFYWVFRAFVSLATQTNAKADAENLPAAKLTRGFGLVIAILFCVTSLTELSPAMAWLNLIVYATYVGFEVTYIWQIKGAAEAFDAKSAPALSEPSKLPTVGIAAIIFGSGLVALLLLSFNLNFLMTPEIIDQRLKAKGYSTRISDRDGIGGFVDRALIKEAGVIEVKEIRVYRGDNRIGGVFVATGNLHANSEQIIAARLGTRTLRNGDKIFFHAYIREPEQDNLDINAWLNAF